MAQKVAQNDTKLAQNGTKLAQNDEKWHKYSLLTSYLFLLMLLINTYNGNNILYYYIINILVPLFCATFVKKPFQKIKKQNELDELCFIFSENSFWLEKKVAQVAQVAHCKIKK